MLSRRPSHGVSRTESGSLALVLSGSRKVIRVVEKIHSRLGGLRRMLAGSPSLCSVNGGSSWPTHHASTTRWLLPDFFRVFAKCFSQLLECAVSCGSNSAGWDSGDSGDFGVRLGIVGEQRSE